MKTDLKDYVQAVVSLEYVKGDVMRREFIHMENYIKAQIHIVRFIILIKHLNHDYQKYIKV